MKFTGVAIVLAFTNPSNADEPCLTDFSFESDSCCYRGLYDAVQDEIDDVECSHEALEEIQIHIGATTEEEVKAEVVRACQASHIPFSAITNEGKVFDKAYFDGGTYYNDQRESINEYGITENELANDPGSRMEDIHDDVAQNNGFTWPSHLSNFESCNLNAAMCCWVQDRQAGDNNGNCATPYDENCIDSNPGDNTDICYVDMSRSPTSSRTTAGFALFEDENEDDAHCHGFAWADDPTDASARFKANNLFYVSLYDHMQQRGYVKNVPGAPMCGCVEKMPVVTRSDCTEIEVDSETVTFSLSESNSLIADVTDLDINFNACQAETNNDLASYVERLVEERRLSEDKKVAIEETIVGETYCREAIDNFLDSEGFIPKPACRNAYPPACGCGSINQKDYTGTVSVTRSGRTCQRWDEQAPHSHSRTRRNYPDAHLSENYCRNPDNEPGGAWCYTTDEDKRWEYCDIQDCETFETASPTQAPTSVEEIQCVSSADTLMKDYRGRLSTTRSGRTCQRWDEQEPHGHSRTATNYPNEGLIENYCRNPDNEPGGAWCYTTDASKRWEYCDVPQCSDSRKTRKLRGEHRIH